MDDRHLSSDITHLTNDLSLDQVIMLLSHELRTPLTSIRGVVSLMQSGHVTPDSTEGKYMLTMAEKNIARLERLAQTIENHPTLPMTLFNKEDLEKIQLEVELKQATAQEQLRLVYQPIVSVNSESKIEFEALIRWDHPTKGTISPYIFIPIAEESGAIHEIGQWIVRQACKQMREWQDNLELEHSLHLNLNLSPLQLLHPLFVPKLRKIVQDFQIDPSQLRLEITESLLMENLEGATRTIGQLRDDGFRFEIDDFGTGYSSLSRLKNLAVDGLKIDRCFLKEQQWNLVNAILLIAADVGLGVIAEGVETVDDFDKLKELGCDSFQGYWFAKPMTVALATEWIQSKGYCNYQ